MDLYDIGDASRGIVWCLYYDDRNDYERNDFLISIHSTREGAEREKKIQRSKGKIPTHNRSENYPIYKRKLLR